MTLLWVAIGGALGSVARAWLATFVASRLGVAFPWGTLLINVAGSFVIGWFAALSGPSGLLRVPDDARIFVMVGLCGGFTTFSAFSLQALELFQAGHADRAALYVALSFLLCLAAVWAGATLGRS